VFANGSKTGDWLGALDDFRNWIIRQAAWDQRTAAVAQLEALGVHDAAAVQKAFIRW